MLSFKALSEKKTKVTINPKLKDVMEKHGGKPCPKTGEAECKCDEKTPAQKSICPTCRGTGMVDGKTCPTCGGKKTKPMEEQAYVSQEEVSEESTEEVAETENSILTFGTFNERTRYAKETGKDPQTGKESKKGGTMDGKGAFAAVRRDMIKTGGVMSSRKKAIQPQGKKKVKGAKPKFKTEPTPVDKIKNKLAQKRAPKPNPYKPRAGESD